MIISGLTDFSRSKPPAREKAVVSELVSKVLERHTPPEKVKVTTEIDSRLPTVFLDLRQVGQVLDNLILNAYQSMPEGGKVTIEARSVKGKVFLSVTDTGCGITEENMKKIYEPLFTTKARGIGLGLSVSKNLLEANGGRIEVESEEGKGTTFTVMLPTKEAKR